MIEKYFHSFQPNGHTLWQGRIVEKVEPGFYLVQLYSWIDGTETNLFLVQIKDMLGWHFYENSDDMVDAYMHKHSIKDKKIEDAQDKM